MPGHGETNATRAQRQTQETVTGDFHADAAVGCFRVRRIVVVRKIVLEKDRALT